METGPHPMPLPAIEFKRILVATDFSQFSAAAVQYAASLARRYSAKLYLLTVVETTPFYLADPSALSQAIDLAREDTLRLQSELSKEKYVSGIETQAVVRSGDVLEEILQVTESEHIDLIGVGTHGRTGASRLLLGSVAQRVFQQSFVPVMLVGPHLNSKWSQAAKHILFPTDLSAAANYALPWALSLARKYNAKLTAIHVMPPLSGGTLGKLDHAHGAVQQSIRELFAASEDVLPEIAILRGSPAKQILSFAKERKCDRIVFGIRRQHNTLERLSSSIAYEILRSATAPILSVREGAGSETRHNDDPSGNSVTPSGRR